MFGPDQIHVEILPDGLVKITTDTISTPNHVNADQLLTFLATLLGGPVQIQPNPHVQRHAHHQMHQHR